jgi:hypothetical protein
MNGRILSVRFAASLALVALLVALSGCGTSKPLHSETISQTDFNGTWPFSVSSGTLRCIPDNRTPPLGAVVFKAGGASYAINGAARDAGYLLPASLIRDGTHSRLADVLLEGTTLCPKLGP